MNNPNMYDSAKKESEPAFLSAVMSCLEFAGEDVISAWAGTEAEDLDHIDAFVRTSGGEYRVDVKDQERATSEHPDYRGSSTYCVSNHERGDMEKSPWKYKNAYFACRIWDFDWVSGETKATGSFWLCKAADVFGAAEKKATHWVFDVRKAKAELYPPA